MQKFRSIFICIFLSGMLYTVFQYLPMLEEETQSHSTELAKKANEGDGNGDDNNESDADADDALNTCFNFNFAVLSSNTHTYNFFTDDYNSFFQKINIPPPKA